MEDCVSYLKQIFNQSLELKSSFSTTMDIQIYIRSPTDSNQSNKFNGTTNKVSQKDKTPKTLTLKRPWERQKRYSKRKNTNIDIEKKRPDQE